jgi:hypothetical protein
MLILSLKLTKVTISTNIWFKDLKMKLTGQKLLLSTFINLLRIWNTQIHHNLIWYLKWRVNHSLIRYANTLKISIKSINRPKSSRINFTCLPTFLNSLQLNSLISLETLWRKNKLISRIKISLKLTFQKYSAKNFQQKIRNCWLFQKSYRT